MIPRTGSQVLWGFAVCGAEEIRTPDLLLAKETLYQLSHGPDVAPIGGHGREPA